MDVYRSMLNPLVSLSFSDACVLPYLKPFGILVSLSFSDAYVLLYVKPVGIFKLF
jgi:hypothetical protein